jgi:hypothetical protein
MRRVWLIRAGEDAEEIDAMRHAGQIGVRYETVGNAREWTHAEIEQGIAEDGHAAGAAMLRAILLQFANDTHVGDLVVSPNSRRREVWVGIISGDYEFTDQPKVHRYCHVRSVEWLGWLDRDAAWMRPQLKSIDRPPTMYELPSREWWWSQVDSREFATQPRMNLSKASTTRTRTRSAPASTSTRKPPVALVRCAGSCGYQWAPTSLVGGLCADCRGD